jgi:hypothetical protein
MMQRESWCASFPTDQVGKVFIVIQGNGKCFTCDRLFTRQESAKHATVVCWPQMPNAEKSQLMCEKEKGSLTAVALGCSAYNAHGTFRSQTSQKPVSG